MANVRASRGLRIFGLVWASQLVSLVGSGLTSFVLGLYVYQRTQSVTQFALILLSGALPRILLSPLAGALVDRWDRRWVMLLSDGGSGLCILLITLLFFAHRLTIWHIYAAAAAAAVFGTFQLPAYIAATTLLVPKQHLGRANGLLQLGVAAQDVIAPALAPFLVAAIQLGGVLVIDIATFAVAVIALLPVRFPAPTPVDERPPGGRSLGQDLLSGWTYIAARPGLLGLLVFFAATSFLNGLINALLYPLVLAFAPAATLGLVVSLAGGGMVLSSLVMSAWGGPRRRIRGMLGSELVFGLGILVIGLRPSTALIALGAVVAHLALPLNITTNQVIWQQKVAPALQGRVFAMRQMVGRAATPLAYLLAGPLADRVFNPLLAAGGPLASSLGRLIGVGPGRGIGLMFVSVGVLALLATAAGALSPRLRLVEYELPDASEVPAPVAVA